MCWAEARPSVQLVFLLRFVVGTVSAAGLPQVTGRTVLGLAAWWCAVACAYLLNGVTDVREDRANGSRRPIARGDLPVRTAAAVTTLLAVTALVLGGLAGSGVLGWVVGFLLLGWAYSASPRRAGQAVERAVRGGGVRPGRDLVRGRCRGGRDRVDRYGRGVRLRDGGLDGLGRLRGQGPGGRRRGRGGGRRTVAVVHGVVAARALAVAGAVLVGAAGTAAAALWAPLALVGVVPVAVGAVWVVARVVRDARRESADRTQRRDAYRAFMVTQYAANLLVLAAFAAG
ncbi:UbiA family prenyltransferase [Streptomyces cirratus]